MNKIRCGFAQNKITPQLDYSTFLDGFGFRTKAVTEILSDLYVKVCSFTFGNEHFLIAQFDLIGFSDEIYNIITSQISSIVNVDKTNIALNCIHTHSAPTTGILKYLPIDYDYLYYVGQVAGLTAKTAMENATTGSFNAQILDKELTNTINRRGRNIIDRKIKCMTFVDEIGQVKGTLCSASCHPVINRVDKVSADFLSVLNAESKNDSPIIFLQGNCGDIKPLLDETLSMEEKIQIFGHQLTEPIVETIKKAKFTKFLQGKPTINFEQVTLPMKAYDTLEEETLMVKDLEKQYYDLPYNSSEKHVSLHRLIWHRNALEKIKNKELPRITVPLQIFSLDRQCAFVFVPFELLTLTAKKLEAILLNKGFDLAGIYILGYSNSVNGYLAPPEEIPFGGYEVNGSNEWYNLPPCDQSTEPTMIKWYEEKIKEL